MLYWNNLQDNLVYVIDLIQLTTGVRMIRFRLLSDPPHDYTVIETAPKPGHELKALGRERRLSMNVPTADGRLFILDSHDIWLTKDEHDYWTSRPSQAALDDPNAPWVNHIPPRFAPA
jgi:hypothetical protein